MPHSCPRAGAAPKMLLSAPSLPDRGAYVGRETQVMVPFILTPELSKVNDLVNLLQYNNSVKTVCQKLFVFILFSPIKLCYG